MSARYRPRAWPLWAVAMAPGVVCFRLFLPVRLVFHAEHEFVAAMSDAEDLAWDFLWLARTGMLLFQTNEDLLRLSRIELQEDPALVGHTRLHGQLAVERRKLAIGRVHI